MMAFRERKRRSKSSDRRRREEGRTAVRNAPTARVRGAGKASAAGLRATRARARKAAPVLAGPARAVLRVLGLLAAAFFRVCALFERILSAGWRFISTTLVAAAERLDRVLTPERVAFGVVVAAAGCLIVSQFVEYRGVQVGQPGYEDVSLIAPAPQRLQETPGEAHAYLLIPVAVAAVWIAGVALLRRRWKLGRLVAIAGFVALAVTLAVDLPKGLDEGNATVLFAGAEATLNEGFWAELAASVGLILGGLLLAVNLKNLERPARRRARRGATAKRWRRAVAARKRKVSGPAGSKA
jgi:hypothetical protein